MSDLVPFNDMRQMAECIAKSNLYGVKDPQQALALMIVSQAEGLHPGIAARDYHIIQNRPSMKADAMLSRFQSAGGKVKWEEYTDECVIGSFSHPQGGTVKVIWEIEGAKKKGIAKGDNWSKYPRAMMRSRCITEGVRTVYPGCMVGIYTPEEIQDMGDPIEGEVISSSINKNVALETPVVQKKPMGEVELNIMLTSLGNCMTMDELKECYVRFTEMAKQYSNAKEALKRLVEVKDKRKAEIEKIESEQFVKEMDDE